MTAPQVGGAIESAAGRGATNFRCGLECRSWEHHATPVAIEHDLDRNRRLRALRWEIAEMWWSDLERMDAVYADFQIGRDRQRRLLTATA